VYKTVQCQWFSTGHCSLGSSCRYAHGDEDDRSKLNNSADESSKKKKKKKGKDKKPELPLATEAVCPPCQPSLPMQLPVAQAPFDPVAVAVQSEFLRSMESLKGNGDVLQHIVNLCTRLQLRPEDLPPPPPGLPSPHLAAARGKATPKPGAIPEGLSTPSTIASTAASPQFSPLDLGNSFAMAGTPVHQGIPLNTFAFPRMGETEIPHFQLPLFVGLAPHPAV
jgi:hypothetical protein